MEAELPSQVSVVPEARPLGIMRGEFVVPDDFDGPLPSDLQRYFDGDEEDP